MEVMRFSMGRKCVLAYNLGFMELFSLATTVLWDAFMDTVKQVSFLVETNGVDLPDVDLTWILPVMRLQYDYVISLRFSHDLFEIEFISWQENIKLNWNETFTLNSSHFIYPNLHTPVKGVMSTSVMVFIPKFLGVRKE